MIQMLLTQRAPCSGMKSSVMNTYNHMHHIVPGAQPVGSADPGEEAERGLPGVRNGVDKMAGHFFLEAT